MVLNMTPQLFIFSNFTYISKRYGVLGRNLFTRSSIISNSFNIHFCKFGLSILRAECFSISSLFNHIIGIIFVSSQKKMFGIHTRSNVTLMQNTDSIRNHPIVYKPRKSMCFNVFTIKSKGSVSTRTRSGPQPTLFSLLNKFKESLFSIFHLIDIPINGEFV